jgi:hypothetical protein
MLYRLLHNKGVAMTESGAVPALSPEIKRILADDAERVRLTAAVVSEARTIATMFPRNFPDLCDLIAALDAIEAERAR